MLRLFDEQTNECVCFVDPNFTPEVTIKGIGPHSINIGWNIPQYDLKKDVHYYKVMMTNKTATEETIGSEFSYAFTNLESATNYSFQVSVVRLWKGYFRENLVDNVSAFVHQVVACNRYTEECGNWSKVVNGTTLDGGKTRCQNKQEFM